MKLTPMDLKHKTFNKKMFGIDAKEVQLYFDDVALNWENNLHQLRSLQEEVLKLKDTLALYQDKEASLKQTLMSVQQVTLDMKQNTKKEAQMILEQAQMQADKMLRQAHERLKEIIASISEIKKQKAQFFGELKGIIETHSKLLDEMNDKHYEKNLEDVGLLPRVY